MTRTYLLATATVLLAILLFDLQGAMIKHMGSRYPVEQIALFRNIFGILPHVLVMLLSIHAAKKHATGVESPSGWAHWKLRRWKFGLARGVILVCAQLCFYFAIVNMHLATATTLAFSGPLFVTLLSIPLLGHKVGLWRALAVVLGFIGVILIMKPGSDAFTLVALFPIGAAICYAFTSVSSRLFEQHVPTALINFYSSVGAIVTSLGVAVLTGHLVPITSLNDWCWFILMGSTGGCAVLCLIKAYRMAEPSSLSPFEYFGIPISFFLGWYFFAETPFDSLFPGALFIVGGGLLIVWRERQINKQALQS